MAYKDPEKRRAYMKMWQAKYRLTEGYRHYLAKYVVKHKATRKKWSDKYRFSAKGRFAFGRVESKRRGLVWEMSPELHADLLSQPCFYCEGPLDKCGIGLDRLDNAEGYSPENVVPSCGECNMVRGNRLTPQETKAAMMAVKTYRIQNPDHINWNAEVEYLKSIREH